MSLTPPPPPPPPPTPTPPWTWTNNPFVTKVNSTDPNSAVKLNTLGIAVGVSVPLIIFGLIGLSIYLWCRKKRAEEDKDRAETRKKKKDEPVENKRKKASEFDKKSKAEKRMDDEIMQQIKEMEDREGKGSNQK